jgi:hypothetical protein
MRLAERLKLDGEAYCKKVLASSKPKRSLSLVIIGLLLFLLSPLAQAQIDAAQIQIAEHVKRLGADKDAP